MDKNNTLMNSLRRQKAQLISVAQKYGARYIKVFGSVARNEEKSSSDVDILVSLPKGYDMFRQRIPMQEELENIIGRNVDLVVMHEISKHLKSAILKKVKDL